MGEVRPEVLNYSIRPRFSYQLGNPYLISGDIKLINILTKHMTEFWPSHYNIKAARLLQEHYLAHAHNGLSAKCCWI